MAHGASDWFGTHPQGMVHRVSDMAELAARLGSPDVFDRRGNVLGVETFANGAAGWRFSAIGIGAVGYPVAHPTYHAPLALAVDTGVGAGDISRWYREYAIPVMTRYGLEVTFCLPLNARDVAVMLTVWDGALVHTYQVRWRQITGELLVHDSTGADHIVATLGALFADSETWYSLKLVVDPLSDLYTRIIFNSATYDVSDVAVATGPFVTSPGVQVSFGGSSDVAAARVFYFDSAIFTMNE